MKKIKIKLLKPFSDTVGNNEIVVNFNGSTLKEMLKILVEKYPTLKQSLYTKNDELTEYIVMFVNDKPISALQGVNTELKNGDELFFFMPVSGG